jgi:hypothetical protein
MAEKQPTLFDIDSFKRPEVRGLVVTSQPGRPLSKAQRAFNRLVTKVEELRAKLERETQRLDRLLAYYGEHVYPRLQRRTALRKDFVRALAPFLDGKHLKQKGERKTLRMFLAEQIDEIADAEGTLTDEDLMAIFKRVHGVDFGQAVKEEMEEARSVMEEMFDDLGIPIDLSDLHPNMTDEQIAAKQAEVRDWMQQQDEEEERTFRGPTRRKTKRQLEKQERLQQAEELRNKSIASMYKQLAKVLHPDLEPDAARKREKGILMQELTAAYRNNDLHTLLRLELEWVHREEGDVLRLTEEKLSIYNQVLKEQVFELERELAELPYHPRYQPVVILDGPFEIRTRREDPAEMRWLDRTIADMEAGIARLRSGDPLDEVRNVIREYRNARRARF